MKKAIIALSVALSLTGCAKLQAVYDTVTETKVPRKSVVVAINSYNVASSVARGYVIYCTPNPSPKGCDDNLIRTKVKPAIDSGYKASKALTAFLRAYPNELGPGGTYTVLVQSVDILKDFNEGFKP